MKRLPVVERLGYAGIDRRYRSGLGAARESRWHVLWLVTRPDRPLWATRAAELVGFTPAWGRAIPERSNAHGPNALTDGRRDNGAAPESTTEQQAALLAALQAEPPDHGLWSGPQVAAFVKDRFGVEVCPQTGRAWLKGLGFRRVVPRPRHPKAATADQQRAWR